MNPHFYADDSQSYVHFKSNCPESVSAAVRLQNSCDEMKLWMMSNMLKLNDEKTEVLVFGSSNELSHVNLKSVRVGESVSVYNIWVTLDSKLTMTKHVNKILTSAWYHSRHQKIKKMAKQSKQKLSMHLTAWIHVTQSYMDFQRKLRRSCNQFKIDVHVWL